MIADGRDIEKQENFTKVYTQTSTNALTQMAQLALVNFKKGVLQLTCATNTITYSVDGSNDGTNFSALLPETQILATATDFCIIDDAWAFIKVSIHSLVDGAHGVVTLGVCLK